MKHCKGCAREFSWVSGVIVTIWGQMDRNRLRHSDRERDREKEREREREGGGRERNIER